ncbi:hypothetical protein JM18_002672 [Phytophthora kernoviae]|uniref:Uncharacterized protein n=2 Tax=Phytophthora kernoviae TaxID=325452 RepID=A0A8T0M392_9STRA|nr:hypothetical protein G195_004052 [Phytophthora kernoviae 00238/432]KAG2528100.1 hypothetical protein JM16_003055 [Phytophthora kernoviae]KAG2529788.1 hypothetical protein JM18_002672 [Phytophthora kernoviae]
MMSLAASPPEAGVVDLLKRLRSHICSSSRSDLRNILSVYERLLRPRTQEDASVQHHLLEIRAKLLACDEDADIVDAVNRMDQVVERCLELSEQEKQQQQSLDAVPVEETMKLLVALAGGQDGETFVLEDPMRLVAEGSTHTPFVNASKRIGDRIRMNDVELVQRSRTLFDKMPAPLEEEKWVVFDCSVPTAFSAC